MADGFAGQVGREDKSKFTGGRPKFIQDRLLFGDPGRIPVEGGVFGQVAVLVGIILEENLIDDHFIDTNSHDCQ